MIKDWLVTRLTPKKKNEERWSGLASNLQDVWEEYFDPDLSRLEGMRSYFSAHDDDLAIMLREMGDWFSMDAPVPQDKPISVAWRRLELEYKDLELILTSVFRRHYSDLPVYWFPLFAPVDEVYGSRFIPADGPYPEPLEKNCPPDGMFLTSRGLLGSDLGHLQGLGLNKALFMEKALPLLLRTKPLHIVFDGMLFYTRFDIPFEAKFRVLWERNAWFDMQFATIGARFDYTPADVRPLDVQPMSCLWEREYDMPLHFAALDDAPWHLDWHAPDGLPWLPLDFTLAGVEYMKARPFALYMEERIHQIPLSLSGMDCEIRIEKDTMPAEAIDFNAAMDTSADVAVDGEFEFGGHDRLDTYVRFDDIPADKIPLDIVIGGQYA